jgi:hypothetical protein
MKRLQIYSTAHGEPHFDQVEFLEPIQEV